MFWVFVDNKLLKIEKKFTLLQVCNLAFKFIPRFCFHPNLSIAANCRMCLVQLEDSLKPVASCAVPVSSNIRIFTNTNLVKKARESVLEFLLINHPLDCPICDQGGECDLQDQTVLFGSDRGRFFEKKRAVKELFLGFAVKTFMSRCIHCTRCIRFANEVLSTPDLGLIGRGNYTKVSTFVNQVLTSSLSGNLADICPVGALTSKPLSFTARAWELKASQSLDVYETLGTNIRVDIKGSEIMRILPSMGSKNKLNWISNKTRFFFDGLYCQRIQSVFINENRFEEKTLFGSWLQAYCLITEKIELFFSFTKVMQYLKHVDSCFNTNFYLIAGSTTEIETVLQIKKFLNMFSVNRGINTAISGFRTKFYLTNQTFGHPLDLVFIGLVPYFETPLFNVYLQSKRKQTKILFNSFVMDSKTSVSAGISTYPVINFLRGKSVFSTNSVSVSPVKIPLFFGDTFISRFDFLNFSSLFDCSVAMNFPLFSPFFLFSNYNQINQAEYGFYIHNASL